MLAQQRGSGMGVKQGGKLITTAASTASWPPTLTLPPAISLSTLTSLTRLPIDCDSVVHWERYKGGKEREAWQAAQDALLELSMMEGKTGSGSIHGKLLWAWERKESHNEPSEHFGLPPHLAGLWTFELRGKDNEAESSSSITSEARQSLDRCRANANSSLHALHIGKEMGDCQLKDIYQPYEPQARDDPSALAPSTIFARLHYHLLLAMREHYLSSWVWSSDREEVQGGERSARASVKQVVRERDTLKSEGGEERDGDEEEEGAIEDGGTSSLSPTIKPEYWQERQRNRRSKFVRLGDSVVLYPLAASSSSLFDKSSPRNRHASCFTLRCFLNDHGHLYLESRPLGAKEMLHLDDEEADGQEVLLGPTGFRAMLVERLKGLQWPDEREGPTGSEDRRKVLDCKSALLQMLKVRGVHVEDLGDDWSLCESKEGSRFLWPTRLCFQASMVAGGSVQAEQLAGSVKRTRRPLKDVAERAKGLVRESIGIKSTDEEEDAMKLYSDGFYSVAGRGEEEEGNEEENEDEDEDRDEEEDEEEGVEGEEDGEQASRGGGEHRMGQEELVASGAGSEETVLSTDGTQQAPLHTFSPKEERRSRMGREEDESDLWGTFGFGPADDDDEGKASRRRQSGAGLDEGAFDLITEDDFSFFDDAARAAGSFDAMEQDTMLDVGQGRSHLDDSNVLGGGRDGSNDSSPEVAMTNSTFVDPPSLPGFTPGSLSATSPAVGGLNAKTPRTPYSPNQDMVDANVAIEGESDSIFHNVERYNHGDPSMDLPETDESHLHPSEDQGTMRPDKQSWSGQSRSELSSKYEDGKFALPLTPSSRKRAEGEEGQEEGGEERNGQGRSRLGHRSGHDRRLSNSRPLLLHFGQSRKLRLGALQSRPEEEMSDLDATVDGTMSDRSSLMDEDSDEDMSSTSNDAIEEEETVYKDRLDLLFCAQACLTGQAPSSEATAASPLDQSSTPAEPFQPAQMDGSLRLLTDNPHMRSILCPPATVASDTCSRSSALSLFAPLPIDAEQSTLDSLLDGCSDAIQVLEQPKLMLGCQGVIASMDSPALAFWQSLGLSAVSGPKDIVALALHCSSLPINWQSELLVWFNELDWTFKKTGLGNHSLAEDGLLALGSLLQTTSIAQALSSMALHLEQWSDTLESLLSRLRDDLKRGRFVVVYAIGSHVHPGSLWAIFKLESDLRALAKRRLRVAPELINVRPYLWSTLASSLSAVDDGRGEMKRLALSVYDSLLVPVSSWYNSKSHLPEPPNAQSSAGIHHPSFTIAPCDHLARSNARFQLQWNAEAINLLDAGLLLHVAYHLAKKRGEMSYVAMMDEKAQGYCVNGWRREGDIQSELESVWTQVQIYAAKARILWRIVICGDEQMHLDEVQHWSALLKQQQRPPRALDITLACVDSSTPMTLVPPRPTQAQLSSLLAQRLAKMPIEEKGMHYVNASQADYAIYPPFRVAMCGRGGSESGLLPLQSSAMVSLSSAYNGALATTPSDSSLSSATTPCRPNSAPHHVWVHLMQVYQTTFSTEPDISLRNHIETIVSSFHQLSVIAKERFLLDDNLPWHLAILRTFSRASQPSI